MPNAKTPHLPKDKILALCADVAAVTDRNRMGCDESWYNPFYAMRSVFSQGELGAMTEQELNNLYALADEISRALY